MNMYDHAHPCPHALYKHICYVCVHTYHMSTHINTYLHICTSVHTSVDRCVCTYAYLCVHAHMCIIVSHTRPHTHIHSCTRIRNHTLTNTRPHTLPEKVFYRDPWHHARLEHGTKHQYPFLMYTCMCKYICVCTCTYVNVQMCVYTCAYLQRKRPTKVFFDMCIHV